MCKLSQIKCRFNLVISSRWCIFEMFKADIHVRNGSLHVSKTISLHKMLHFRFIIDIIVNNYNLPRSLKGGVPEPDRAADLPHAKRLAASTRSIHAVNNAFGVALPRKPASQQLQTGLTCLCPAGHDTGRKADCTVCGADLPDFFGLYFRTKSWILKHESKTILKYK